MKKQNVLFALILLLALLAGNVIEVGAFPPQPATYFGTVQIDGIDAPIGTEVSASIDGVIYAFDYVKLENGRSMYAVDVPGEDPEQAGKQGGTNNEVIHFYIGGHLADQTASWQSGAFISLNLSYIPNHPPTSADFTVSISEDGQKTFSVSEFSFSDTDAGDSLSGILISTLETAGTLYLDINNNGSLNSGEDMGLDQAITIANIPRIKFKPDANANGSGYASFGFKVSDGEDYSLTTYLVTINVTAVNDAPSCASVILQARFNMSGQVAPSCSDPENDDLIYALGTQPLHGTVSLAADMLNYVPDTNYTGPDSFTYRANDGYFNSSPASVFVKVLPAYPHVVSIVPADANPTQLDTVHFTVTFTSNVSSVGQDDFELAVSGVTGEAITDVSGTGNPYTVTVFTGTGDGTLGLNLVDNNSILDEWGNPLGGTEMGDGNFTGSVYTVDKILIAKIRSQGKYDGGLRESSEDSNIGGRVSLVDKNAATFDLGDNATDRQLLAILSFNIAGLPIDAEITNVTLKIKLVKTVGTNPFTFPDNPLEVDIQVPYFGTGPGLAASDFQAVAAHPAAFSFSPTPAAGQWYFAQIDPSLWSLLDWDGMTQFRLRFKHDDNDDRGADYLRFYSGNAASIYRPVLVIEYLKP